MVLENHSETFNLTGNIDSRYFQEVDGGQYKATSVLLYNAARDAMNYYKNRIFKLDTSNEFHTEKVKTVKDEWTEKLNEEERKRKYGAQLAELEKRKREWREAHIDVCRTIPGGPDLGDIDEMTFFSGYQPEKKENLAQAVAAYKWLKENFDTKGADGDTVSDKLKASIPQKEGYLTVADEEAKKEYFALIEKWTEELGIPVKPVVEKVTVTRPTIARLNSKSMKAVTADNAPLEDYMNGLIAFLTQTDKAQYLKDRDDRLSKAYEELTSTIQTNLLDAVDSTKGLEAKTDMGNNKVLTVFERTTEDSEERPVVFEIEEVERDTGKSLQLKVDLNEGDNTVHTVLQIKNTEDIKKALQALVMIFDGTFDKYKDDIESIIDSLA